MEHLVALPVNGDAFLLRRSELSVLVDGGKSSALLVSELAKFNVQHLDIVVCTHADYDHSGGLVDLLNHPTITVGEFWLPGAWAESIPQLLTVPEMVVDELIKTLDEQGNSVQAADDPDEYEQLMHSYVSGKRNEYREQARNDDQNELHKLGVLEPWVPEWPLGDKTLEQAARTFQNGRSRVRYRKAKCKISKAVATFWLDLIDTAERIRKIAVQAIHHGVPVRWFDFGEFDRTGRATGGVAGTLIPLNAVELGNPPPPQAGLSFLVRLTPVNEECLVFLSPGEDWESPSIVFTGDSPLGNGVNYSKSWLQWPKYASPHVIATAPHHGSESNFLAYKHLGEEVFVHLWMRSGGTARHPGPTYRQLQHSFRICTHCPREKKPRQAAEVFFRQSPWCYQIRTNGHICTC